MGVCMCECERGRECVHVCLCVCVCVCVCERGNECFLMSLKSTLGSYEMGHHKSIIIIVLFWQHTLWPFAVKQIKHFFLSGQGTGFCMYSRLFWSRCKLCFAFAPE